MYYYMLNTYCIYIIIIYPRIHNAYENYFDVVIGYQILILHRKYKFEMPGNLTNSRFIKY